MATSGGRDCDCDCCEVERKTREAWQLAHENVHDMEAEARIVAFVRLNERLAEMNEVRRQINDERGSYLMRDRYEAAHESLRSAIDARLKLLENSRSNNEGRIWMMGVAITGIMAIVQIAIHFIGK